MIGHRSHESLMFSLFCLIRPKLNASPISQTIAFQAKCIGKFYTMADYVSNQVQICKHIIIQPIFQSYQCVQPSKTRCFVVVFILLRISIVVASLAQLFFPTKNHSDFALHEFYEILMHCFAYGTKSQIACSRVNLDFGGSYFL